MAEHRHAWLLQGTRRERSAPADYRLLAPLWRRCLCGAVDRVTHLCEGTVIDYGRMTTRRTCGNAAKVERLPGDREWHLRRATGPDALHWFCGVHDPERLAAAQAARDAKAAASYEEARRRDRARDNAYGALPVIDELLHWADAQGPDGSGDEWLDRIVRQARALPVTSPGITLEQVRAALQATGACTDDCEWRGWSERHGETCKAARTAAWGVLKAFAGDAL